MSWPWLCASGSLLLHGRHGLTFPALLLLPFLRALQPHPGEPWTYKHAPYHTTRDLLGIFRASRCDRMHVCESIIADCPRPSLFTPPSYPVLLLLLSSEGLGCMMSHSFRPFRSQSRMLGSWSWCEMPSCACPRGSCSFLPCPPCFPPSYSSCVTTFRHSVCV